MLCVLCQNKTYWLDVEESISDIAIGRLLGVQLKLAILQIG